MASKKKQEGKKVETKTPKQRTIYHFLFKVFLIFALIASVVFYTDKKGYFNPDYTNDHTRRKWDSYYKFTENNEVDIAIFGNSRVYTGLNPKNLSEALGVNAFILASPSTTLTDAYFALKEAVKVCKPKIAIIETYAIRDYDNHKLDDSGISFQYQSFNARKDIPIKINSTPKLFTSDHYLPAWSTTIRNHNFIFTDKEQLIANKHLSKQKKNKEQKLYLGRFVIHNTGIDEETLKKYDEPGFIAFNGSDFKISKEANEYIAKTAKLCRDNDIKLVFLTLPMYYKHMHNYEDMKKKIEKAIEKHTTYWIDLQDPYDYELFTTEAFENTVNHTQHMTYYGSIASAYKVANYIYDNFQDILPRRNQDIKWRKLFYGEEGYFENYGVDKNDKENQILAKEIVLSPEIVVKEIDLISKKDYNEIIIKVINNSEISLKDKKIQLILQVKYENTLKLIGLEVPFSPAYMPIHHSVFQLPIIKDIEIIEIYDISLEDKS